MIVNTEAAEANLNKGYNIFVNSNAIKTTNLPRQ